MTSLYALRIEMPSYIEKANILAGKEFVTIGGEVFPLIQKSYDLWIVKSENANYVVSSNISFLHAIKEASLCENTLSLVL